MVSSHKLLAYLKKQLGEDANMVIKDCDWSEEGYTVIAETQFFVPMEFILSVDESGKPICKDCGKSLAAHGLEWCKDCFTKRRALPKGVD